jgi:crotonobetainyl-CoA:carnitine CoA-transferase CaiB-like acyl-CoA transferase
LKSNNDRVKAREWLLPDLRTRFAQYTAAVISEKFQRMGLPYAAITRPQDLFDDPHLQESGGLTKIQLPADTNSSNTQIHTEVPLLPLTLNGKRLPLRTSPPSLGHDTFALLQDLGYDQVSIDELTQMGIVKAFCT